MFSKSHYPTSRGHSRKSTVSALRKLKEHAERGLEFSKQVFAQRGRLAVPADYIEGLRLTPVTADG